MITSSPPAAGQQNSVCPLSAPPGPVHVIVLNLSKKFLINTTFSPGWNTNQPKSTFH